MGRQVGRATGLEPAWQRLSEPLDGIMSMGHPQVACPPIDTEGLGLFLRQSCIFILDVFPEAYFS